MDLVASTERHPLVQVASTTLLGWVMNHTSVLAAHSPYCWTLCPASGNSTYGDLRPSIFASRRLLAGSSSAATSGGGPGVPSPSEPTIQWMCLTRLSRVGAGHSGPGRLRRSGKPDRVGAHISLAIGGDVGHPHCRGAVLPSKRRSTRSSGRSSELPLSGLGRLLDVTSPGVEAAVTLAGGLFFGLVQERHGVGGSTSTVRLVPASSGSTVKACAHLVVEWLAMGCVADEGLADDGIEAAGRGRSALPPAAGR